LLVFYFLFVLVVIMFHSRKPKKAVSSSSSRTVVIAHPERPPMLPNQFRFGVHLRFLKTSGSTANVAWLDLLNLYVLAISTTVGYSITDAIRLKKVSVYMLPLINTSSTGVSIAPTRLVMSGNLAGAFGTDEVKQCYPGAEGATMSTKPKEPMDDWVSIPPSTTAFSITGGLGAIVDVEMAIQLRGATAAASTALASTGATAGVVYGNYLDSSGTQFLQAQGPANNALVWV
jgi:hypothetical protein